MNDTDEWYEIERIDDDSWEIREGTMFGMYLLAGEERALLVDAGCGAGDLRGTVSELVDVPVTLLLSHSHWDHIGAAAQFDDVRIHDRERTDDGRVTTDAVTDDFGYGPDDWIADWREAGRSFPDGFDPGTFEIEPARGVEAAEPGETVDLGGRRLELLHVPGHSPGQLAVLDREAATLYGGDVLHADHDLYIHFEGCDVRAYRETLDRLVDLYDDDTFETLYVSHARPLSGGELSLLEELRDGLEAIIGGELDPEFVDDHPPANRYEIAGSDVLVSPDAGSQ